MQHRTGFIFADVDREVLSGAAIVTTSANGNLAKRRLTWPLSAHYAAWWVFTFADVDVGALWGRGGDIEVVSRGLLAM